MFFASRGNYEKKIMDKIWRRCICHNRITYGTKFLAYINSMEASIKFTIKYERENKLPFLDMLVMKKKDGILAIKKKPAPTII